MPCRRSPTPSPPPTDPAPSPCHPRGRRPVAGRGDVPRRRWRPRQTFREMAQQLADLGYAVLVPDVYYRDGGWAPFDDGDGVQRRRRAQAPVRDDLQGHARDHGHRRRGVLRLPRGPARGQRHGVRHHRLLHGRPHVADRRGPTAVPGGRGDVVPRRRPGRPTTRAARTCSPTRCSATVYVGGAKNDASFTPEHAETLDKALTAAGVEHTIEFYDASARLRRPDNAPYDEAAAERHWEAMERVFGAQLG